MLTKVKNILFYLFVKLEGWHKHNYTHWGVALPHYVKPKDPYWEPWWRNDLSMASMDFMNSQFHVWLYNPKCAPYFIEYNVHTSIVRIWVSLCFFGKNLFYFYFSRIISKELIIASLFIIKAILNPFSATLHV